MEINGLTPQQVEMLDIMWSLDSKEELYNWVENLPTRADQHMAHVLISLLLLEALDEFVRDMESYPEANEVLSYIMEKK